MRGVPVTVGGVSSPTQPRRLSAVWTAVAVVGIMFSSVGAAQTTQATPSVPQAQTPTADQLKALRQRAEQGDAAALCQLGTIYENGQAVAKDSIEAAKWFSLGVMLSGDLENTCADKRDRLKRQLPTERYAEAQQRAKEWRETVHIIDPALRKEVKPHYNEDAMRAKITGIVPLEVVVGADGTVVQCRVLRSLDDRLDLEAVKAARKWRFAPARIGNRAVPTVAYLEMTFEIRR